MSKYFVFYREDFNDQEAAFDTIEQVRKHVDYIKSLFEDGEAEIYQIIKGVDVTDKIVDEFRLKVGK